MLRVILAIFMHVLLFTMATSFAVVSIHSFAYADGGGDSGDGGEGDSDGEGDSGDSGGSGDSDSDGDGDSGDGDSDGDSDSDSDGNSADDDNDENGKQGKGKSTHTSFRRAVENKEILPLGTIRRIVRKKTDTEIISIDLERKRFGWVYEFKVVDRKGRLLEIYVDASNGRILQSKYD